MPQRCSVLRGIAIGDQDGDGRTDIAVSLTVHAEDGELRSDDAEAEDLAGRAFPTPVDTAAYAAGLVARGVAHAVIFARGAEGSVLATAEGDDHTLGLSLVELCVREAGFSCARPAIGKRNCKNAIGTEACENQSGYCNGPLKPGTRYRFKVRAYTTRDKHSETNWSQPITTDPDNTAYMAAGIIVPVLFALCAIGGIFCYRR